MRRDKEIAVKLLWCFVQVLNQRLVFIRIDKHGHKVLIDSVGDPGFGEGFFFHLLAVATPIGGKLHKDGLAKLVRRLKSSFNIMFPPHASRIGRSSQAGTQDG